MRWFYQTTAAVLLAYQGQYMVTTHWPPANWFLGGYLTAFMVNVYLEKAKKL